MGASDGIWKEKAILISFGAFADKIWKLIRLIVMGGLPFCWANNEFLKKNLTFRLIMQPL
jgi:hypothetical protein